jgi:hypothetical protein
MESRIVSPFHSTKPAVRRPHIVNISTHWFSVNTNNKRFWELT